MRTNSASDNVNSVGYMLKHLDAARDIHAISNLSKILEQKTQFQIFKCISLSTEIHKRRRIEF